MPQFNLFNSSEHPRTNAAARAGCLKRRRVPTAAEQCGCTTFRELVRRVANGSYSVARSAPNSVRRSSNMKRSAQRTERRRGRGDARGSSTSSVPIILPSSLRFFLAGPGGDGFLALYNSPSAWLERELEAALSDFYFFARLLLNGRCRIIRVVGPEKQDCRKH